MPKRKQHYDEEPSIGLRYYIIPIEAMQLRDAGHLTWEELCCLMRFHHTDGFTEPEEFAKKVGFDEDFVFETLNKAFKMNILQWYSLPPEHEHEHQYIVRWPRWEDRWQERDRLRKEEGIIYDCDSESFVEWLEKRWSL